MGVLEPILHRNQEMINSKYVGKNTQIGVYCALRKVGDRQRVTFIQLISLQGFQLFSIFILPYLIFGLFILMFIASRRLLLQEFLFIYQ